MNSGESKGSAKRQRDRYWSLMLVGEHGRITPIPRARAIVLTVLLLMVAALGAAALFGWLYARQSDRVQRIQAELTAVHKTIEALRDQKDELTAQLVLNKATEKSEFKETESTESLEAVKTAPPVKIPKATKSEEKAHPVEPSNEKAGPTPRAVEQAPQKGQKPLVKPGASIKEFNVTYIPDRAAIRARFRIYNDSRPKKRLSGCIVVVFRDQDQPPSDWIAAPQVPLIDGRPVGNKGQVFRINNFRTVEFMVYDQKPPVLLDNAMIFVFTAEGDLIHSESHDFSIDFKAPAKETESGGSHKPRAVHAERDSPQSMSGTEMKDTQPIAGAKDGDHSQGVDTLERR